MITILQPTTTEQNLGGICYSPYWYYAFFRSKGHEVKIFEDVTMRSLRAAEASLIESELVLIDLSSYGQVLFSQEIFREVKKTKTCAFIGYAPLIRSLELPLFDPKESIEQAVFDSFFYSDEFRYSLLSDCDSHIKSQDSRKVVPVFLSVGCNKKCPFCYATTEAYPFGVASKDKIRRIIDRCSERGWNIHFCDEDFFAHPHIEFILDLLKEKSIKYICLTTVVSLLSAVERFGLEKIKASGNFLNEIGLETADKTVLSKNQGLMQKAIDTGLKLFWLVMTFMPNESLSSLRATGEFLEKYGYKKNELLPRIVTNSTTGGLGQFFQPYHGTPWHERIDDLGVVYNHYSTRLFPSFIGHKLLNEVPVRLREIQDCDFEWFSLYGNDNEMVKSVFNLVDGAKNVKQIVGSDMERAIVIAQFARLGIVGQK